MTAAALSAAVLAVLVAAVLGRAYRVADRKVQRRDKKIRELTAELTLTTQASDRQAAQVRHWKGQACGYRGEVARLSARNAEMRDQLDLLTGATREPTLTEAWTAFMAELDVTYPEDQR